MQGVLIDDHRIHVDFSQSVSKLSEYWRKDANDKRRSQHHRGGFGGVDALERKRQYRDEAPRRERGDRYGMVFDKQEMGRREPERSRRARSRSRSVSPIGSPPRRHRESRHGRKERSRSRDRSPYRRRRSRTPERRDSDRRRGHDRRSDRPRREEYREYRDSRHGSRR